MTDLPVLLQAHIESVIDKPAVWGVDDCSPWCGSWVEKAKDVAVVGGTGAAGAGATIGPVIPDIIDAVTKQHDDLTSGEWARIIIGVAILGLTIWGIYRKVRS